MCQRLQATVGHANTRQREFHQALDSVTESDDVEHRVEVMTRAVQRNFAATEQQGRTLLRLTVDAATVGAST